MLRSCSICLLGALAFVASAQAQNAPAAQANPSESYGFRRQAVESKGSTLPQDTVNQSNGLKQRGDAPPGPGQYQIAPGTHVLLNMINSVSTRQAYVGQRIYLETAFPVMVQGRIVVPQGSWVTGTVTHVKKPGRVKGHGELQVRFDSLTLPNGVTRNFNSDLGSMDPRENETMKNEGGKITGPGDKKSDVGTVVGATTAGTVIGSGVGAAAGNVARGAGVGAGAGAAAGLLGVLLTRGPDATLSKGSTVEMVLDRPIAFHDSDLDFGNAPPRAAAVDNGNPPAQQQKKSNWPFRLPLP
jgi:type IV secretion system protein VirB10